MLIKDNKMVSPSFYLDDETKLHEKEVEFLCDKKNAHLFSSNEEDLSDPKKKRKLIVSSPEYLTFLTNLKGRSSYAHAYLIESSNSTVFCFDL